MKDITVDLDNPSLYAEPDSKFYRFKRKLTLSNVLRKIRKQVDKEKAFSLLEIGTGSGFTIAFLESEFPDAKLFGIEYDPRLVELTQSKVKSAKIVQGNAENFDIGDQKFDVIVSLQVIEHLYHPDKMIEAVKRHLNPGGTFIFTTPNLGCYSKKIMKDKWHGYREDHVSLKTNDEWVTLTVSKGFEEIYSGSTFFTGIPIFNKLPLGIFNWALLYFVGSMRWKHGESFIGIFRISNA